jgi:MOSC domain-containing protein YiiM
MIEGKLESIHIAAAAKAPMQEVGEVRAVPDAGLEGDRYFLQQGTFYKPEPDFQLTLIESEAIDAVARDYEIKLQPGDPRRNLVTRGVALNHLVGKEFQVGEVRVRGIRLCEPCSHLEALLGQKIIHPLLHRAGLRAAILSEGTIRAGDSIRG